MMLPQGVSLRTAAYVRTYINHVPVRLVEYIVIKGEQLRYHN